MPFQDFHDEFKRRLRQSPTAGLDYVFGSERANLGSYVPTQVQTREFVQDLQLAIAKENKDLSEDRNVALGKVFSYNENPGTHKFSKVDPSVFAFQLALRIREPSLMNQKEVGVCGETSLMIFFAKNAPSAFADYAISLMLRGEGKFYSLTVTPHSATLSGSHSGKMPDADLVIIGSLGLGRFAFMAGTNPEDVEKLLIKAGFSNVSDKTLSGSQKDDDLKANLRGAEAALSSPPSKLVVFSIHSDLVKDLLEGKRIYAGTSSLVRKSAAGRQSIPVDAEKRTSLFRGTNHWVAVSRLELDEPGNEVKIKLYSWQHSALGEFPLDAFMTYYGGYIVADPPKLA
jgi:hypothetical protein